MRAFVIVAVLGLSGCAHWFGPGDGKFVAVGATPTDAPCEVAVEPIGKNNSKRAKAVTGAFRESFIINPNRKGHRLTLTCDNAVVASRTFKYGREVGFGGEVALD